MFSKCLLRHDKLKLMKGKALRKHSLHEKTACFLAKFRGSRNKLIKVPLACMLY